MLKLFTHPPEHALLLQATMMSRVEIPMGLRPPRLMSVAELLSGPAIFLRTVSEVHPRLVPHLRGLAQLYHDRPGNRAYWNRHDERRGRQHLPGEAAPRRVLLERGRSDSARDLIGQVER